MEGVHDALAVSSGVSAAAESEAGPPARKEIEYVFANRTGGVRTPTHDGWWLGVANQCRLWKTTRVDDTVRIVEREYDPARLSDAERDSARHEAESLEARVRGDYDAYVPMNRRIYETVFTDDQGYLWVLLTPAPDDSGSTFDVFDPKSRYLGSLSVPDHIAHRPIGVMPVVRGDWMAYLTKHELAPTPARQRTPSHQPGRRRAPVPAPPHTGRLVTTSRTVAPSPR